MTPYYPHVLAAPAAPVSAAQPADEAAAPPETDVQLLFNPARLAGVLDALDALHTAASERRLHQVATVSRRELAAWLEEVAFLVEETLDELNAAPLSAPPDADAAHTPGEHAAAVPLRLVRRSS